MSNLVEMLYPLPDLRRTPLSTLRWWESRRPRYNLIVGAAGMVTLTVMSLSTLILPGASLPPLRGVVMMATAYALAANLCYSLGWLAEMVALFVWGRRAPLMGPLLFREGLIFSVGLTLLPILVVTLVTMARILSLVV